jgi:hypothetical protein
MNELEGLDLFRLGAYACVLQYHFVEMYVDTRPDVSCSDFGIKETLNMSLELIKDDLNVRFMFD